MVAALAGIFVLSEAVSLDIFFGLAMVVFWRFSCELAQWSVTFLLKCSQKNRFKFG